jgi:hypothetical protein
MALTDRTIQSKAKPANRPFKLFDGHGLYLLVKPNGGRYWRMQYRFKGRAKTIFTTRCAKRCRSPGMGRSPVST